MWPSERELVSTGRRLGITSSDQPLRERERERETDNFKMRLNNRDTVKECNYF